MPKRFSTVYNQYALEKNMFSAKADMYETILKKTYPLEFKEMAKERKNKMAMFVPHLRNTGGIHMLMHMKDIFEELGVEIDVWMCYPYEHRNLTETVFGKTIKLNTFVWDEDIAHLENQYDGAISPYFDMNLALHKHFDKVLYYSQGDYGTLDYKEDTQQWLYYLHRFPVDMISVSSYLDETIQKHFSRKTTVVPCGIDPTVFYSNDEKREDYIVVMGEEGVPKKRVEETLKASLAVVENLGLKIVHITPREEKTTTHPLIETKYNLSREEVAAILRKATAYVQGSFVEGFSLPPLEAMAVGTPVVSTDNGGIRQYGKHEENVLLCGQDDFVQLQRELKRVLQNKELQEKLRKNGLVTADSYHLNEIDVLLRQRIQRFISDLPLAKNYY